MTPPITETVKLIVACVVGCLLLWGAQTVIGWREGAAQNEQRGRTLEATSGIIGDGQKADENRAVVNKVVEEGRATFNRDIEEGRRNEPETAARADRPVPNSVRNAYRERRLARERLGRGPSGDEARAGPPDPSER